MIAITLLGCRTEHEVRQAPSPRIIDVEYAQLVSPNAVAQFGGKLVRVRAAFFMLQQGTPPGVYTRDEYAAFKTVAPGGTMHAQRPASSEVLTIVAPHAFDYLFPTLHYGDTLVIEGLAVPSQGGLIIQADSVQKVM